MPATRLSGPHAIWNSWSATQQMSQFVCGAVVFQARELPFEQTGAREVDADGPARVVERLDRYAVAVLPVAVALGQVQYQCWRPSSAPPAAVSLRRWSVGRRMGGGSALSCGDGKPWSTNRPRDAARVAACGQGLAAAMYMYRSKPAWTAKSLVGASSRQIASSRSISRSASIARSTVMIAPSLSSGGPESSPRTWSWVTPASSAKDFEVGPFYALVLLESQRHPVERGPDVGDRGPGVLTRHFGRAERGSYLVTARTTARRAPRRLNAASCVWDRLGRHVAGPARRRRVERAQLPGCGRSGEVEAVAAVGVDVGV